MSFATDVDPVGSRGISTISPNAPSNCILKSLAARLTCHSSANCCGVAGMMFKVGTLPLALGVPSRALLCMLGDRRGHDVLVGESNSDVARTVRESGSRSRLSEVGRYGEGGGGARECIDEA